MLWGKGRGSFRAPLAADLHVWALNLRSHGPSPHDTDGSLGAMAGDVIEWLDAAGLLRPLNSRAIVPRT